LVALQLALATILLVGAGLLTHSFVKLSTVNKGYDSSRVVALQLLFPDEYSIERRAQTIDTLLRRLRQISDVQSAGFARHGMLIGEELLIGTFVPPGRTLEQMRSDPAPPRVRSVSEGFLRAMGTPVLAGREFTTGDTATRAPVIVISRSIARQYFGAANPIGQFVNWYVGETPVQTEVVGVVEDVRQESLSDEAYPEIYVHYRQLLSLMERWPEYTPRQNEWAIGFLSFAIRTNGDPAAAVPTIRQLVGAVDPNIGIDAIVPMTRLVGGSIARERFYAVMMGAFAGVSALLAAIGVYGLLAYIVIQRTQEIGTRMALGAQRAQVMALVLRRGLTLATVGIAVGLVGAAAGARLLRGMLFGVTPFDPTTFMTVSLMFGLVAMVASYVPARRATAVDPVVALKSE
jgi:putative ABC transport system permease protein